MAAERCARESEKRNLYIFRRLSLLMEYLIIELVLFALTALFHAYHRVTIFRSRRQALVFWALVFVLGAAWDNYAVYRGHWLYPPSAVIDLPIGLIPFEDYLFIFLVPYAVLVLYAVANKMSHTKRRS
jgi:lycopene cyclase domain-containing protein